MGIETLKNNNPTKKRRSYKDILIERKERRRIKKRR